jgi:zinc transporter 1
MNHEEVLLEDEPAYIPLHHGESSELLSPTNCDEFMNRAHRRRDPDHDHIHAPDASCPFITMITLNFFVFIAELVTGYITNSLSLQSDAWHMLSDEASLLVGYFANRFSHRNASRQMSFGWLRSEVLGGLVNATFLLALCLIIIFDAIERFFHPPEIERPLLFLIVGFIGLAANIAGLILFHNHGHSDNLRGVFLHILGDFMGSIGVMITGLVYYFTTWAIKPYFDPFFSLLIVGILMRGSIPLFAKTAKIVAERCPDAIDPDEVVTEMMKVPNLVGVHDFHVWVLCNNFWLCTAHVVVAAGTDQGTVLKSVHNLLISYGVSSSTIEIEFVDAFPPGFDYAGHCAYGSSMSMSERTFLPLPVYRHFVGCPHLCEDHEHDHHEEEADGSGGGHHHDGDEGS